MDNVKNTNVGVFEGITEITPEERRCLERALLTYAYDQIGTFNQAVNEEVLYLVTFGGRWILYGRPDEEDVDKPLMYGVLVLEDLLRLGFKLEGLLYDG